MDEDRPLTGKIIAFVLTLIAVPVLFVGTCVPLALFINLPPHGPGPSMIVYLVDLYSLVFLVACITLAVRTKNPGIRWAIIVLLGVVALWRAFLFAQQLLH